jgi:acyl-CoA synthetase (AMP-forming)/AMP-acid ligase II/pimeloyl-ACP methyl ester carboxylesterase
MVSGVDSRNPLYPFTSHYLNLGGLRYHYLDEGQGEPVVMVHGNPTWSFFYRNLVLGLRDQFRCIIPDHIGMGLSDKPADSRYDYTLARRAEDLEALLEHLGVKENVTLVLHDWGGMIGMAYAHRHPERIKRLVVLNTAAFLLPAGKRLPRSLWLGRNTPLRAPLIRGLNAFCWGAARWCVRRPLPPAVRDAYLAPYDSWANRVGVLRFVEDIPLRPSDRAYPVVREVMEGLHRFGEVPLLICWGMRDFVFDAGFLAEWVRRFPRAQVHRFAEAGHYLLEDAGEAIIPLVRDFLADGAPWGRPLACRQAGGLPHGPNKSCNIACHLPAMAKAYPNTQAIVQPQGRRQRQFTFRELDAQSDAVAAGLQKIGLERGMRTVLMVPPSLEFFALTFALFKLGAVVVLTDPGMGVKNLSACLAEAEPEAFIGVPKAHLARVLLGWAKATVRIRITVGPRLGWGGTTLAHVQRLGQGSCPVLADTRADELAAILFTSGSTGVAKGATYTHGIFAAQVEMLKQMYGIEPGEIDLPTFPLFGLFAPALGMSAIIPEMDFTRPGQVDPRKIITSIQHFGVTNLFGSPALIRRVGEYGEARGERLPTLRRAISAGAPVPARVIERFAAMLETCVEVHTPYGATEALPVATLGSHEILQETRRRTAEGAGVCVGRPVEGMTVRVIRISDEPIAVWSEELVVAEGTVGEIVVQGPVVTRAYFNRPDLTRLAKIEDPARGSFWHRMGDLGYLDAQGRLWFCGRKSQRVQTPAGELYTIPCEGIFNAHPAVLRTALVGVQRNGATEPVLCVERDPHAAAPDEATLKRELAELSQKHGHTKQIRQFLLHPAFPVDIRHNAKIFREKLAAWAAERLR